MEELKSEMLFPKEERVILKEDDPNHKLIWKYANALNIAEDELRGTNDRIKKMGTTLKEKEIKKALIQHFTELMVEPSDNYEDGNNNGVQQCINLLKKLDFNSLINE